MANGMTQYAVLVHNFTVSVCIVPATRMIRDADMNNLYFFRDTASNQQPGDNAVLYGCTNHERVAKSMLLLCLRMLWLMP